MCFCRVNITPPRKRREKIHAGRGAQSQGRLHSSTKIAVEAVKRAVNLDLRGTMCFKLFRVRCMIEKESRGAVTQRNKRYYSCLAEAERFTSQFIACRILCHVPRSGTTFDNIFESLIAHRFVDVFPKRLNHVRSICQSLCSSTMEHNSRLDVKSNAAGNSITFEL